MKKTEKSVWRLYLLSAVFCVAVVGLLTRLVGLSVVDRPFLMKQSQARILRKIKLPAFRGMITDRLATPLAVSTPVNSVWVNPKAFQATRKEMHDLSSILGVSGKWLANRVKKNKKREFVYIKRLIRPSVGEQVKALDIEGVFLQREYRRYYPEGESTAHIVGLTNVDDSGQEGMELAYNLWLAGQSGVKEVIKDRKGHIISNVKVIKQAKQGRDLVLSIDHRIQYLAYQSLKETMDRFKAKSGSVVVLDAKTGEVLAMVNQPSYNPNNRPKVHDGRYRNRAETDIFEPGSVMKPFTIALGLESGKYTADTKIDTNPGWMRIGGYRIKDDLNYGVVTLTQLLQKSSNIAAAKILLSLDPTHYWMLLHEMGFGQRTHSGFPGESAGVLERQPVWYPSVVATLAYGYGVAVTTLQLAKGYMILADGGINYPVSLLKLSKPPVGTRVLPEKVAKKIVAMLETVVQKGGTGTRAQVPGFRVAGKTGTAYIASAKGYDRHRYMASFVGVAPVDNPRLVIAVVVRDPQGQHFGGLVAAPVFAHIMKGSLQLLGIVPSSIQ
jgi:cell division protein FtsI (penicillin-binding protein 3)